EAEGLLEVAEQFANRLVTDRAPDIRDLPDPVFREHRRDPVGVVHVVADMRVPDFQLLDGFDVFEPRDAPFERQHVHRDSSTSELVVEQGIITSKLKLSNKYRIVYFNPS